MKYKVLLVGEPNASGFARQRLAHFEGAIRAAGHSVQVLDAAAALPERVHADVVVSAGMYRPTYAAVRVAGERPLWIDLPGDPYADAQAVVARGGAAAAVAEDCARVFTPALARADAFSTIGDASRWSLVGQLGLLGRSAGPDQIPIHAIPIAWPGGLEAPGAPTPRDDADAGRAPGPIRVLLCGSFNTWFDDEAVAAVLCAAMQRADVVVEVTGGPGQPGGYERFVARMSGLPVRFHGWIRDPRPIFARSEVLLTLDRGDVWEPGLGSRTRVLTARHAGVRVVASAGPEMVDTLARIGQVRAVRSQEEAVLAVLDRTPAPDPSPIAALYDAHRIAVPLLRWLEAPIRAPAADVAAPLVHAQRAAERAEAELARVRRSWAFKLGRLSFSGRR
jgi:hypothetical protein